MEKYYSIILTLLLAKFAVNGTTTPNPRKPIFKSAPDRSNPVLVGGNIKLEWIFKFHSASDLRRILLFSYELRLKAKSTIASKEVESGIFQYSPFMPAYQTRYVCEISFKENGIGKASISIQNVQFNHTYDYGISLQLTEKHLPAVENSVSVKVVDMVLGDKGKNTKIIRSWFGQKLPLKCDVIYHNKIRPFFKWYKKSFTGSTAKNLFAPNNTRILVIEKVNGTDFGEYTCEARTRMVKVRQKFKVDKLGYAGSPRNVEYTYYPISRSYALFWEQPSTKDGHWVRTYILEEWKEDKKTWVKRKNITALQVTIRNVQSTTKYRLCSANEIGYTETSCSKPIQLPKTAKRGKSSQFWPNLCLILVMAFLSGILPRHE